MKSKFSQTPFEKEVLPNLLNANLFSYCYIIIGAQEVGGVISCQQSSNFDEKLIPYTKNCVRGVLKSLEWSKRKETT